MPPGTTTRRLHPHRKWHGCNAYLCIRSALDSRRRSAATTLRRRTAFTTSSREKLQKMGWAWPGRAACAREKRNSGGCDRGQEHRQTYKFLFCIPLSSFPTHTLYCMHVPMRDCCRDKFRREIRVVSPFSFFSPNFFLDRVTRPVPFRRGGSLSCFLSSHPVHRKGPPLAYRGRETVNSPLGTEITLSSVLGEERKVSFERIRDPLMRAPTN